MTPLLVLLFGVAPQTAIGTDLLFAAAARMVGVAVHPVAALQDAIAVVLGAVAIKLLMA